MKVSIDKKNRHTSKPTGGYASINHNIVDGWQDIGSDEFANLVGQGCSFSCGHFDGERKAAKWQGQQLFAVDIDDLDSPTPIQAIGIIRELFGVEPTLVYNSFSSTATNNKYRLVVAADEVITDPIICVAVLKGLVRHVQADKACTDLARLFYGTTPNKIISWSNDRINTYILYGFANKYTSKPQVPRRNTELAYCLKDLSQPQLWELSTKLKHRREALLHGDGSRYVKLEDFCYWLMNRNFMSPELAKYIVYNLIESNPDLAHQYVADWDKDYQDVSDKIIDWCETNYA